LFRARAHARAALASFTPPALVLQLCAHARGVQRPRALGSMVRRARAHAIRHAAGPLGPFPSPAAIGSVLVLVTAGAGVGSLALSAAPHHLAGEHPSTHVTMRAGERASAGRRSASSRVAVGAQAAPSSVAAPAGRDSRASSPRAANAAARSVPTPTFGT